MNWFEFNEARTQRSVAFDVIDWPDYVVTEGDVADIEFKRTSRLAREFEQRGREARTARSFVWA